MPGHSPPPVVEKNGRPEEIFLATELGDVVISVRSGRRSETRLSPVTDGRRPGVDDRHSVLLAR